VSSPKRPFVLEWFRHDRSASVVPTLAVASVCTISGCILVAVGLGVHRFGPSLEMWMTSIGLFATALGPGYAIFRLRNALGNDSYIALRSDGVSVHDGTDETLVLWDDLTAAHFDEATGAVVLERREGEPVLVTVRFAGIELPRLAKRIDELRLKAAFNLLPTA